MLRKSKDGLRRRVSALPAAVEAAAASALLAIATGRPQTCDGESWQVTRWKAPRACTPRLPPLLPPSPLPLRTARPSRCEHPTPLRSSRPYAQHGVRCCMHPGSCARLRLSRCRRRKQERERERASVAKQSANHIVSGGWAVVHTQHVNKQYSTLHYYSCTTHIPLYLHTHTHTDTEPRLFTTHGARQRSLHWRPSWPSCVRRQEERRCKSGKAQGGTRVDM